MQVRLRESLYRSWLQGMNVLNEVVTRYPDAISFAPGRPWPEFFQVDRRVAGIGEFLHRHTATGDGSDRFGQYGRTNGLVPEVVANHVRRDYGMEVPCEAIMLTTGCQEAMLIALLGLFEPATDVLLITDPTYFGITGLAALLGIEVLPVPVGPDGLQVDQVAAAVAQVRSRGKRPRALYDIPDFHNPLGTRMPVPERIRLLQTAREHELLILEDNPYGMFAYDGDPYPPLKALDKHGVVIYLGSFSKTVFPGLRLGYLIADQALDGASKTTLAAGLSLVKSLTTVNTSPLSQLALAELLDRHGGSLQPLVAQKLPFYRANRDAMLAALERHFAPLGTAVRWNRPGGGFFIALDVPCEFTAEEMARCARDYRVICCPMSLFSVTEARRRQVRLSFSYVTPAQIDEGASRLAAFIGEQR